MGKWLAEDTGTALRRDYSTFVDTTVLWKDIFDFHWNGIYEGKKNNDNY